MKKLIYYYNTMNKTELIQKAKALSNKILNQFIILTKGEYNFNIMLYLFGLAPAIVISILFQKNIDRMGIAILQVFIYTLLALYFAWHIYVIIKTLKVQPEHKIVRPSKKELYKDKSEEEIESIKKEKRKDKLQKFMLLKAWDTTPNYVLIGCVDAYMILTQVQGILSAMK